MRNPFSNYGRFGLAMPLTFGKVHVVMKAGGAIAAELANEWLPTDDEGVVRYHATLAGAVAACTASQGDVILIAAGHTETISTATALTMSVAGVRVVGLGWGSTRPVFTLDTGTDATINVTAANVQFENCVFVANFAAIVACFTTTAATDFALLGCEFRDTSVSLNFVNIVDTNTTSNNTDGLRIENCKRIGLGATASTTIVKMDGTNNRVTIKDNWFTHAATTGGAVMIIANGKLVTNLEMEGNKGSFTNATNLATGILIITNGSTNSGYLVRNHAWGLDATTEILVTASSGFVFSQNYYS